jgi:putative addiction module component (TIGR02574 family)
MIAPLDDVTARALSLSIDERARLARRLILSLENEPSTETPEAIDAAWREEISRRVAECRNGTAELIPADQVFAELDRDLHSSH